MPEAPSSLTSPLQRGGAFATSVLALFCWAVGWMAMRKLGLGEVAGYTIGGATFGIGLYAISNLKGAAPSLWVTFGLKLLSVTGYKIMMVAMVSYMMKDCGFTDQEAQHGYLFLGLLMSSCTLLAGSITDAIGLRRTLAIGVTFSVIARLVMISVSEPWLVLTVGLVPVAIGEALCTPVLVAATRRFSTAEQRSVAFSVFYALLNLGFMAGYFIFDGIKQESVDGSTIHLFGGEYSIQRVLFAASAAIELLILPGLLFLRNGSKEAARQASLTVGEAVKESARLFSMLVRHPGFHRLLMFLAVIGLLKIVFSVMDGVLPTFLERELGEEGGKRAGRANAVNSVLILILAPIAGILTRKLPAYPMVIFGGFITALSFVFLALPQSVFQSMADGPVGQWIIRGYFDWQGAAHPLFLTVVLWQVVFSVGEAFYSPRVYEYAVSIAPKGQEASYAALSAVPLLMGKITTGAVFGWLLTSYCPAEGPRDTSTMWSIVGGLVLLAPVLLLLLKPFIRMTEEGKE
jgi:MFS family permease